MSSPPISISYVQPTYFHGHLLCPAHPFLWPFLMSGPPISMAISYVQSIHFPGHFLYLATHFHSHFLCPAHSFPHFVFSAPIFHGYFLCPAHLFPWPFLNSSHPFPWPFLISSTAFSMDISYVQHTPYIAISYAQHTNYTAISYVQHTCFHSPFLTSSTPVSMVISYVQSIHFSSLSYIQSTQPQEQWPWQQQNKHMIRRHKNQCLQESGENYITGKPLRQRKVRKSSVLGTRSSRLWGELAAFLLGVEFGVDVDEHPWANFRWAWTFLHMRWWRLLPNRMEKKMCITHVHVQTSPNCYNTPVTEKKKTANTQPSKP